jgi:hypothetical protein
MDEAHIQHGIGFVKDKGIDIAQVKVSLIYQIKQAARSRYDNVYASAQGIHLSVLRDPAKNSCGPQPCLRAIILEVYPNLSCQLSGGS